MFLFLSTNFFTSSSFVWLDAAEPWQFGFQSAATPVMEGIINFHNHIMFFLIGVGFFVFWLILFFSSFYFLCLKTLLPTLSSVLKVRNKKLQKATTTASSSELLGALTTLNSTFEEQFSITKSYITNSTEKISFWGNSDNYLQKSNNISEKLFFSNLNLNKIHSK